MRVYPLLAACLVGFALAASACSDLLAPHDAQSMLSANRAKWQSRQHRAYSFTVRHDCFCAIVGPVRVMVDDSVVAAFQQPGAIPVDARFVETVDALFAFIDRAIAGHAATIDVTYDPLLGYPTQIIYDGAVNIADDELTVTVSDVRFQSNAPN